MVTFYTGPTVRAPVGAFINSVAEKSRAQQQRIGLVVLYTDLGTQDIATMTPPELDTTRHTYIGNTYTGQLYN